VLDPVNRVLLEREGLDRGLSQGLAFSAGAHGVALGLVVAAALLAPKPPLLQVAPGFVVALPRGGGGTPSRAEPAPAAAAAPEPVRPDPVAPPEPPPKVVKPPREEPRRGLPDPEARPKKATPTPKPAVPSGRGASASRGGEAGGRGTSTQTPGLEFGPPGPGVPGGVEGPADFYLAGVQRKIWMVWTQQLKSGFSQPIGVTFTILADGSVTDVRVLQSSGVTLLDHAAQRAVLSAAPFAPLPREYGTNRYTIQALFKPQ
jgi:protein TonB